MLQLLHVLSVITIFVCLVLAVHSTLNSKIPSPKIVDWYLSLREVNFKHKDNSIHIFYNRDAAFLNSHYAHYRVVSFSHSVKKLLAIKTTLS